MLCIKGQKALFYSTYDHEEGLSAGTVCSSGSQLVVWGPPGVLQGESKREQDHCKYTFTSIKNRLIRRWCDVFSFTTATLPAYEHTQTKTLHK